MKPSVGFKRILAAAARETELMLAGLANPYVGQITPTVRQAIFRIVFIANSKGGIGKSTLAVHLAAWLSRQGHRVTLADCDTQQSSSE